MAKRTFFCVDGHTCGNPVRLVAGGVPVLKGNSMAEKRQYFLNHFDWIRKALMFEPRGHDVMSGSMLFPPHSEENDLGILFIETSGCLPMCGHGTIGTITMGVEEGLIIPRTPGSLRIETPAGLIIATYKQEGNKVKSVKIVNVPSFVLKSNITLESSILGKIYVDIAYGGNFYAIIDPQEAFQELEHFSADNLISMSREIRAKLNGTHNLVHPENPDISGLSHVLWTGKPSYGSTAKNAVFYGDKGIDRSPCGTGTSARMAQWYKQNKLKLNEDFIHESIIGSQFIGQLIKETKVGNIDAVVPTIEGWAVTTGYNHIMVDESDPFAHGFQVV